MSDLNDAIEALHLASEVCEERDRAYFKRAHEDLLALRDEAIAVDQSLDDHERVPTGDDFNYLFSLLLSS